MREVDWINEADMGRHRHRSSAGSTPIPEVSPSSGESAGGKRRRENDGGNPGHLEEETTSTEVHTEVVLSEANAPGVEKRAQNRYFNAY